MRREAESRPMNNKTLGIIATVLVAVVLVWLLLGGRSISCRESFWDKDRTIIEVK